MFAPPTAIYTHGPGLSCVAKAVIILMIVGHVTYSFINMLFIPTGIFDDKFRPQILSVGTIAYSPLSCCDFHFNTDFSITICFLCDWMIKLISLLICSYRQNLWAELIIKNPCWYEQHIYETVCHMTNVT
jgi:hypothetical protein